MNMKPLYPLYITAEKILNLSPAEQDEVKRAITTDLMYLASDILRDPAEPPMTGMHARMASQFVVANEESTSTWSDKKEHHIVAARGFLKTTLLPCSIVQNILASPNIRIEIFGSTQAAARRVLQVVEHHLKNPVIQLLWPEMKKAKFANDEFVSPLRTNTSLKDPTLCISSLQSANAGFHGEILYLDDIVNEKNATEGGIEKAVEKFGYLRHLVEGEGGYLVHTCTRWGPMDIIGVEMAQDEAHPEVSRRQFFVQPVMKVRTDGTLEQQAGRRERLKKGYAHLLKSDVELAWPENEQFDFEHVHRLALDDNFRSQYMLEAEPPHGKTDFTEEMIQSFPISPMDCPKADAAQIVTNWDWATLAGTGDSHAGVTMQWNCNIRKIVIVDIVCERFTTQKARLDSVVETYRHFDALSPFPVIVRIENAIGARDHEEALIKLGVNAVWQPPNTNYHSRDEAVQRVWTSMARNCLRIAANCRNRDVLEYQMRNYSPDAAAPQDDVIDALARGVEYCLKYLSGPPERKPQRKENGLIGADLEERGYKLPEDESQWPEKLRVTCSNRDLIRKGVTRGPDGQSIYAGGDSITFILQFNKSGHKSWMRLIIANGVPWTTIDSGFAKSSESRPGGRPLSFPTDAVPYGVARMWSGGVQVKQWGIENPDDANEKSAAEDQRRIVDPYGMAS
jgi:hypothetical protein